jgi:hypothetical protein
MTTENKDAPICPSCDEFIPNNETPGAYMGAISRKDNKTEICSACGTREALLPIIIAQREQMLEDIAKIDAALENFMSNT